MAIHPDDPPWQIFELPRIVSSKEHLEKIINIVDSPSNTLAICSGSLGANVENNVPDIIRQFGKLCKISFLDVRSIKITDYKKFHEVSPFSKEGSLDIFQIMKALHETDFKGYLRPDHGRLI